MAKCPTLELGFLRGRGEEGIGCPGKGELRELLSSEFVVLFLSRKDDASCGFNRTASLVFVLILFTSKGKGWGKEPGGDFEVCFVLFSDILHSLFFFLKFSNY